MPLSAACAAPANDMDRAHTINADLMDNSPQLRLGERFKKGVSQDDEPSHGEWPAGSTIARTRDPRPGYLHFNSRFADLYRDSGPAAQIGTPIKP
jgi:hypothetical protein